MEVAPGIANTCGACRLAWRHLIGPVNIFSLHPPKSQSVERRRVWTITKWLRHSLLWESLANRTWLHEHVTYGLPTSHVNYVYYTSYISYSSHWSIIGWFGTWIHLTPQRLCFFPLQCDSMMKRSAHGLSFPMEGSKGPSHQRILEKENGLRMTCYNLIKTQKNV